MRPIATFQRTSVPINSIYGVGGSVQQLEEFRAYLARDFGDSVCCRGALRRILQGFGLAEGVRVVAPALPAWMQSQSQRPAMSCTQSQTKSAVQRDRCDAGVLPYGRHAINCNARQMHVFRSWTPLPGRLLCQLKELGARHGLAADGVVQAVCRPPVHAPVRAVHAAVRAAASLGICSDAASLQLVMAAAKAACAHTNPRSDNLTLRCVSIVHNFAVKSHEGTAMHAVRSVRRLRPLLAC